MSDEKVFSVSQVSRYIQHILAEDIVLYNVYIEGEVSNYKLSGGHAYFSIKDEESQLECVQFSASGYKPQLGDKVVVLGKANYYPKTGKFSFIISQIKPYGVGEIYRQFLILKDKLEKLGLFSREHKKDIPKYPKRIGVVSSEKGAVIQDIINVAKRRNPYVDIVLYPAKVQGIGAEEEIAFGIDYFNESNVDTIIVARGGGSIEDLAPFYTEFLALKIFDSIKPIITAVGHETDYSLVDYVSDMRAPTPSAAAEIAVTKFSDICTCFSSYLYKIFSFTDNKYQSEASRIKYANLQLYSTISSSLQVSENKLHVLSSQISALNPMSVLLRGYAKVKKNGKEIHLASQVNEGDKLNIRFSDDEISCKVSAKGECNGN